MICAAIFILSDGYLHLTPPGSRTPTHLARDLQNAFRRHGYCENILNVATVAKLFLCGNLAQACHIKINNLSRLYIKKNYFYFLTYVEVIIKYGDRENIDLKILMFLHVHVLTRPE